MLLQRRMYLYECVSLLTLNQTFSQDTKSIVGPQHQASCVWEINRPCIGGFDFLAVVQRKSSGPDTEIKIVWDLLPDMILIPHHMLSYKNTGSKESSKGI